MRQAAYALLGLSTTERDENPLDFKLPLLAIVYDVNANTSNVTTESNNHQAANINNTKANMD